MREGPDLEERLPYGRPQEKQEVYFDILHSNLDKIASASFDREIVNGGRGRRGLIVVAVVVGICRCARMARDE